MNIETSSRTPKGPETATRNVGWLGRVAAAVLRRKEAGRGNDNEALIAAAQEWVNPDGVPGVSDALCEIAKHGKLIPYKPAEGAGVEARIVNGRPNSSSQVMARLPGVKFERYGKQWDVHSVNLHLGKDDKGSAGAMTLRVARPASYGNEHSQFTLRFGPDGQVIDGQRTITPYSPGEEVRTVPIGEEDMAQAVESFGGILGALSDPNSFTAVDQAA